MTQAKLYMHDEPSQSDIEKLLEISGKMQNPNKIQKYLLGQLSKVSKEYKRTQRVLKRTDKHAPLNAGRRRNRLESLAKRWNYYEALGSWIEGKRSYHGMRQAIAEALYKNDMIASRRKYTRRKIAVYTAVVGAATAVLLVPDHLKQGEKSMQQPIEYVMPIETPDETYLLPEKLEQKVEKVIIPVVVEDNDPAKLDPITQAYERRLDSAMEKLKAYDKITLENGYEYILLKREIQALSNMLSSNILGYTPQERIEKRKMIEGVLSRMF